MNPVVVVFWWFFFFSPSIPGTSNSSSSAYVLAIRIELHNMQNQLVELLILHQVVILEAFC